MGVRAAISALASRAPVPVFPVVGAHARDAVQDLGLRRELRLVGSPRHATVLLIAGSVPPGLAEPIRAAHDALPRPRATVRWRPHEGERFDEPVAGAAVVERAHGAVEALVGIHRELLSGDRASEAPLLPDREPAPWHGVGPYGQGGSGMTGGVPYGRPLPERAEDRDGLMLDQLHVRVGPLLEPFPPGLSLDLKLQGDVIQEAAVADNPFPGGAPPERLVPFLRALHEPLPIAVLEVARARQHLRWVAEALAIHGLPALGRRALRLATRLSPGDRDALRGLHRAVRRSGLLAWSTPGVGAIEGARVGGGPVGRAAGLNRDVRAEDAAYRRLGFRPVVQEGGDAAARWRQRLAEADQSLDLAERAGDAHTEPTGRVESPRGPLGDERAPTRALLDLLPELLPGLDWGDAVTTLVSLDLDLEETAALDRTAAGEAAGR